MVGVCIVNSRAYCCWDKPIIKCSWWYWIDGGIVDSRVASPMVWWQGGYGVMIFQDQVWSKKKEFKDVFCTEIPGRWDYTGNIKHVIDVVMDSKPTV